MELEGGQQESVKTPLSSLAGASTRTGDRSMPSRGHVRNGSLPGQEVECSCIQEAGIKGCDGESVYLPKLSFSTGVFNGVAYIFLLHTSTILLWMMRWRHLTPL